MLCSLCGKPIRSSDPTERVAGSGPTAMRVHISCVPPRTPREFRERVSLDDRSAETDRPLRERELREGE